jgi:hypothetical protein
MKNKSTALISQLAVSIIFLAILTCQTANGQYELSWYTIDGGGGRSTGGSFVLTGTIGQPDAAYSSGGNFELLGGFWPGGPLCVVDFRDFAKFAEWWLVTGTDLPADLYEDINNIVNELDLRVFLDYWLCYCPTDWPLK